ncbi:MAG: glycosyltransferase family 9 protein [Lentimicrobiaceae bacterium]|nr:glycosyltransferase family 9 protein [Lentimicrobiaceae bacterium]
MRKILVIRFSSIGDIVLTTPVIRCLKKQIQDAEIHVLTKKKFANLYKTNIYINKVYEYDDSLKKNIEELKLENYDYVVDLQKNKRSVRVTRALGRPHASFPKLNFRKFLLSTFKIDIMPDVHIVDRYFKAVEKLNVRNDFYGLDFFISDKNNFPISELPVEFQNGYYAFVIGGTYKTKILPPVKIAEVLKKINKPVILLGGPDDVERAEEIISLVNGQPTTDNGDINSQIQKDSQVFRFSDFQIQKDSQVFRFSDSQIQKDSQIFRFSDFQILNLVGRINLEQSASIVKNADSVLTNDTGLMHIAAAFHKNIVSVWGNTVPELGMYPYLPKEPEKCHIIECKDVRCRPCSKLGFKECPKKHFRCMMEIDTDRVAESIILKKHCL